MIRVFVAVDHLLIREGLRKVFACSTDMEVVGEARTGAEVLSCIPTISFDILLLDLRFPDKNGMNILLELPSKVRKKTLVISVYDEDRAWVKLLRLSLSINTVNSYRHRVLEKMELHSTIELVQYAMRHLLVE